ncbi:MAG TPA: phosphopantetheine-binding protein [Thermoanaerobaculia bacterium]|nr:phosphopantetheine-binding protein [Thermoanaerobaculia bacterium]
MADEQIATQVREFITRFVRTHLGDDDDIFATGFVNSMFAMQLVSFVEMTFGIEIESDDLDIENFRSVNAICRLVERKRAAATA